LKIEITKIRESLAEQAEKDSKHDKHKLVPIESGIAVLRKELEMAYKQIKSYEKDVRKMEEREEGGLTSEKYY
jgi:hypothetical protein